MGQPIHGEKDKIQQIHASIPALPGTLAMIKDLSLSLLLVEWINVD